MSLVTQLVPAVRPDLTGAWDGYRRADPELRQVCRIIERDTGRPATPEGLLPRLIVLFHRHSLGRDDVSAAARSWLPEVPGVQAHLQVQGCGVLGQDGDDSVGAAQPAADQQGSAGLHHRAVADPEAG